MAENIQSYDKKEYLFSWKALFGNIFWYGPSFVNRLSFSEIYTGSVVASDLQVKIIITIENSLLTKLPYATIYILLSCNHMTVMEETIFKTRRVIDFSWRPCVLQKSNNIISTYNIISKLHISV
jgi:hypothetical protein